MRLGLAVAAVAFLTPAYGIAEVTRMHVCERASITRIVELQSDGGTGVPCRVVYKRPMEDQSATSLWNAQSDTEYCAQKYDAFIAKIENEYNWACTAELPGPTVAQGAPNVQTTAPNTQSIPTQPTESSLQTAGTPPKESKNPGFVAAPEEVATLPTLAEPVEPPITSPNLGAALPLAESRKSSDTNLSMAMIRQLIPSGQYVADGEIPHSGSIALCPAGGFFIWNTKRPARPEFEMGPDESFQFDLTELTDEPPLARAGDLLDRQCHEEVAAGYCSDAVYTGSTQIHPQLSKYFGCGSSSVKTAQQRALVLFRSSVDQKNTTNSCHSSPSTQHMALASMGVSQSTEAKDKKPSDGLELVILPNQSKSAEITRQDGAICRYIRG